MVLSGVWRALARARTSRPSSPLGGFVNLRNIVFVNLTIVFVNLRNICFPGGRADTYPSFATGGSLWFMDLTITDPTYILPALTAASMIVTIELGADTGQPETLNPETLNPKP